jgi:hypothetical protein
VSTTETRRRSVARWRAKNPGRVRELQRRALARYVARKHGRPVPDFPPLDAAQVAQLERLDTGFRDVLTVTPTGEGPLSRWRCVLSCGHTFPRRGARPPKRLKCWWCLLKETP